MSRIIRLKDTHKAFRGVRSLAEVAYHWGAILLSLGIPLFLIATGVRLVINSPWLYEYGFNRYRVGQATGLSEPELQRVAEAIRDYFNSQPGLLQIEVTLGGERVPLFNEREILHMQDVQGLVQRIYRVQEATLLYFLLYALWARWRSQVGLGAHLSRAVLVGSLLTLSILAITALGAFIGFDRLFRLFHLLSFSNDLWLLDPRTDYLIRLFPQGFFYDATVFIAALTTAGALLTGGIGGGYLIAKGRGG